MRFMMIVKASEDSEAGVMPTEELLNEMGKYNEELAGAGVLLAGEGLHPSSTGARIRFSRKNPPQIIDGPFSDTDDLVAGFWLIDVKSREEALEWAKRVPFQDGELEVRRVFEADDFGDQFTPEMREREDRLRERISRQ